MQNLRAQRGLTLIEVVISLGILVFMGAITWQTIAASLMLRDILEYEDTVSRSARVAMDQIKKELRVAFLTSNTTAVNTYQTVFIGKDGGDEDQLWFNTIFTEESMWVLVREIKQKLRYGWKKEPVKRSKYFFQRIRTSRSRA